MGGGMLRFVRDEIHVPYLLGGRYGMLASPR